MRGDYGKYTSGGTRIWKFIIIYVVVCSFIAVCADEDLYKVLGVKRSASPTEVKRAYKQLAREWHPDKNKSPGANERFMKINEAYETLADEQKRKDYDNFGATSASQGQQRQQGGFDNFFNQGPFGFHFNFGGFGQDTLSKHRITLRSYVDKILPESRQRPYFLYAYSNFCYTCMEIEMMWDKIVNDMEAIGVGIGTIQAQMDHALASKTRVSSVPTMMMVINGKLRYFSGRFSLQEIRNFVRNNLPHNLITMVNNKNYEAFLNDTAHDNKVRALFFGDRQTPTLRYQMAAYHYRNHVTAGYVMVNWPGTSEVQDRFRVNNFKETLLMIAEDTWNPMATLSMKQLPRSTIDEMLESNKFLHLPRLSSQVLFDQICPAMSSEKRKKICVVLLTRNIEDHDVYRASFRRYAQDHFDMTERVRYAYVYEDTQFPFVNKLTRGEGVVNDSQLKVAVMWRKEKERLQYDWLQDGWPADGSPMELQRTRRRLHQMLDWCLSSGDVMPYFIEYPQFLDEAAEGILYRIGHRLMEWSDILVEKVLSLDETMVITCGVTVAFVLLIGFMMHTMSTLEEERVSSGRKKKRPERQPHQQSSSPPQAHRTVQRPTVSLHQFVPETFNKLLLHTAPGVRSVVMMVDEQTKDKLLQEFAKLVVPYAGSDAFIFAFMPLEDHLDWYRRLLLEATGGSASTANINLRNCTGTVLAMNGPRKYFCIYHAHQERAKRIAKRKGTEYSGGFMGFDGESSESESERDINEEILFEADLMWGFPTWMERLVEGSLKRMRIEKWPNMFD